MAPAHKNTGEGFSMWRQNGKVSFRGAVNWVAMVAAGGALLAAVSGTVSIRADAAEAKQAVTASTQRLQRVEDKTADIQNSLLINGARRDQQMDDLIDRTDRMEKKVDELLKRGRQ